jgi:hypothetical protein
MPGVLRAATHAAAGVSQIALLSSAEIQRDCRWIRI